MAQGYRHESDNESRRKRTSERVPLKCSVAYSTDIYNQEKKSLPRFLFGDLMDISESGLCMKARRKFPVPSLVSLFLKLSDDSSGIKMLGKTVWAKPEPDGENVVGIKFIGKLPPTWKNILNPA